eukprot:CAMPEP_0196800852 /NCGR_PEP_ID=MMETSP1362-20130617/373_1 /TAXON_ID=163516 /ORGANISM="Leptocylindrus danicus, Strain CCMP1856" /LENGTH=64 /DNA_ID=CAMNT_0042171411 /DNA_START=95 /DNA_END=286 /DNA_ORIENTATION=+
MRLTSAVVADGDDDKCLFDANTCIPGDPWVDGYTVGIPVGIWEDGSSDGIPADRWETDIPVDHW